MSISGSTPALYRQNINRRAIGSYQFHVLMVCKSGCLLCVSFRRSVTDPIETFKSSRWFTRGWTLQELIAPATVIFFSKEWERISEKRKLLAAINEITGIPNRLLLSEVESVVFSVAKRMSWASNRTITCVEDEAYSLMGIFGVNMPLLYGEK
jgi:hypothetical protein